MLWYSMNCSDLLDRYVSIRLVGRAGQTRLLMNSAIVAFGRHLKRVPLVRDLTDATISEFASARLAGGSAIATVQQNQLKLLALWRFACEVGERREWPTIKAVSVPERIPAAWTREELARIFGSIKNSEGLIGAVPATLWWETLHRLLWDSGERVAAILGLKWSMVSLADGTLLVPAELRKGQTRDKTYRLSEDTIRCLEALPHRKGLMLKWDRSACQLYYQYRIILRRAELPTDRRSMFHRMRRSVASHIKAAGGDAMEAMDHASAKTTASYLDPRIVPRVSPCDLLFRP